MDNELIVKALKASLIESSSISTDEMIAKNILSIRLEEQAEEMQKVKNERDEALAELENIKLSFEKINKVLQSNEELKTLFDKVAEELDKPQEEQ
jgi:hypothetical protein|uniref:Uncharacterized protein n=2 Tax=unclassified Caudoviricetes TaxID=2788787 RepID=A0A8S5MDG3_9CAUD|nr:MAG TPA: hypothetical protein [Siphoviridae sp. ctFQq9]DAD80119.1 MAG TPA: hypothetical protein [Siphoviridae sp. ctiMh36]DAS71710.1 MAG TPA: hypothetical protein [Caudoviricetes sp.]